jgi:hypothetical protein
VVDLDEMPDEVREARAKVQTGARRRAAASRGGGDGAASVGQ